MRMVTAAVIIEEGRLLIARRGDGSDQAGLWELPGGKTEEGETLKACLKRELKEELGITVSVGPEVTRVAIPGSKEGLVLVALLVEIEAGAPVVRVHSEIAWVKSDEIGKYEFCPADVLMMDEVGRLLGKVACQ